MFYDYNFSIVFFPCLYLALYYNIQVYNDEYFRLPHLREPKLNNAEISSYLSKHLKYNNMYTLFIYYDDLNRLPLLSKSVKRFTAENCCNV